MQPRLPLTFSFVAIVVGLMTVGCQSPEPSAKPGINDRFKSDFEVDEFVKRFESESREVFEHRNAIVAALDLSAGDSIADIGAGTGFYTFMFADEVSDSGKVYAVDIAKPFVDHIGEQAKTRGKEQIVAIQCSDKSTNLPANSVDKAFICDTYHHFEYPNATMKSLAKAMRPGGVLMIIDFIMYSEGKGQNDPKWTSLPEKRREWIRGHVRCDRETIIREVEAAGFRLSESQPTMINQLLSENHAIRFVRRD